MKTSTLSAGLVVTTPAFVIRSGIDANGRAWKIRARVLPRRASDPQGMVPVRPLDREFCALPGGRRIFRRAADLRVA